MRIQIVALLLLILFSCQKESISDNEIIGKWEFKNFIMETSYMGKDELDFQWDYLMTEYPYDLNKFGKLTLEIRKTGEFIFESYKGAEKLKLEKMETNVFAVKTYPDEEISMINGYNFFLKTKSGQRFKFKLCLENKSGRLITVPWLKNGAFADNERPYSGNYPIFVFDVGLCSSCFNSGYNPYQEYCGQVLGVFEKI